ncbi:MAG: FAD-dependent oxidoreductase [Deinococcaceae bacterium]
MNAIVLGGGFSGLSSALRLALSGCNVTLIEQNSCLGGKGQGWKGIPTGPTVLTLPEIVKSLYLKAKHPIPNIEPISPLTTYTYPDGRTFSPETDLNATLAQLNVKEQRHYTDLLEDARQLYENAKHTFLFANPPSVLDLTRYALRSGLKAHPLTPLHQWVESGPHLTPFFLRFATYMGANPYLAPAVLHNIAHVELSLGVWHLDGGFSRLAQDLETMLRRLNVTLKTDTQVLSIDNHRGGVREIWTSSGKHKADLYVSALDRHTTLRLLGRPLPRVPLSVSGFALLLHLNEPVPRAHRVHFCKDYKREWADIGSGHLPKDPTLYLHTDGDKAFAMVNSPAEPRLASEATAYTHFLLERIQHMCPLSIRESRTLTARDYAAFGHRGALYGRAPEGLFGTLRPSWTFPGLNNLWQVGGTVHPGGGVPLSILSGWNASGLALGLDDDLLGE